MLDEVLGQGICVLNTCLDKHDGHRLAYIGSLPVSWFQLDPGVGGLEGAAGQHVGHHLSITKRNVP